MGSLQMGAPASVWRDIAAASSFFSFLERRYEAIHNPFRGTKAWPAGRARKDAAYPSQEEATIILYVLPPEARAAAAVMLFRGLHVGALPSLTIWDGQFKARSKGKDIAGRLPAEALAAIRDAGLDNHHPFEETTETKLADAIRKRTAKLAREGDIAAAYSAQYFWALVRCHRVPERPGYIPGIEAPGACKHSGDRSLPPGPWGG
jgi:hypothetical protein